MCWVIEPTDFRGESVVDVPDFMVYDLKNAHEQVTQCEQAIARYLEDTGQDHGGLRVKHYIQGPDQLN